LGEFDKAHEQIQLALNLDPQNKESKVRKNIFVTLIATIGRDRTHQEQNEQRRRSFQEVELVIIFLTISSGKYMEARDIYQGIEKDVSSSNVLALKLVIF
jgi:hypothetical protein